MLALRKHFFNARLFAAAFKKAKPNVRLHAGSFYCARRFRSHQRSGVRAAGDVLSVLMAWLRLPFARVSRVGFASWLRASSAWDWRGVSRDVWEFGFMMLCAFSCYALAVKAKKTVPRALLFCKKLPIISRYLWPPLAWLSRVAAWLAASFLIL